MGSAWYAILELGHTYTLISHVLFSFKIKNRCNTKQKSTQQKYVEDSSDGSDDDDSPPPPKKPLRQERESCSKPGPSVVLSS